MPLYIIPELKMLEEQLRKFGARTKGREQRALCTA
jgi:hypothetical protein